MSTDTLVASSCLLSAGQTPQDICSKWLSIPHQAAVFYKMLNYAIHTYLLNKQMNSVIVLRVSMVMLVHFSLGYFPEPLRLLLGLLVTGQHKPL